jgi:tetratricopeptide (TPR) repeat protein
MKKKVMSLLSFVLVLSLVFSLGAFANTNQADATGGTENQATGQATTTIDLTSTDQTTASSQIEDVKAQIEVLEEMIEALELELEAELEKLEEEFEASEESNEEEYEAKGEALEAEYEAEIEALEAEIEALEEAAEDAEEALEDEIKAERERILDELKGNKEALKAYADELKKKLESIEEELEAEEELLESLADFYEEAGELEEALTAQKEAVKKDLQNLERYRKLSDLMDKNGHEGIKAFVNGEHPNFDVPPVIKEGRTLIPFRAIAEALQADVAYEYETKTITVSKNGVEVKLVLGESTAYINGQAVQLDVPAQLEKGRTLVPIRFLSEALNANVQWDAQSQSIVIVEETTTDITTTTTP